MSTYHTSLQHLQYAWLFPNEQNQAETHEILLKQPPHGHNAIFACGGLCALNLASLDPGITHVCLFDLSDRVAEFWERAQTFFQDPKLTYETAKKRFLTHLKLNAFQPNLELECTQRLSFLSSRERFERIHSIFQKGHFSFTRLDLCQPDHVESFLKFQRAKGLCPHVIYISSAPSKVDTFVDFDGLRRTIGLLPEDAILIDAEKFEGDPRAVQRVYLPPDRPRLVPSPHILLEAIATNDDKNVSRCIELGADPNEAGEHNESPLMWAISEGFHKSIQALIDSGRVDINASGYKGRGVLHSCVRFAIKKQNALWANMMIKYLIEHGANINAQDDKGITPFYYAVRKRAWDSARELLRWGADPTIPDHLGILPKDLLSRPGFIVPEYARDVRALLERSGEKKES
jgi:hypothetical protein